MILFDNVHKIYNGGIKALEGVSFKIDTGEFSFIVGPSGAGKTTLMRLLIREEKPTQGDIIFEDINVPSIPRKLLSIYRQQLGVVFQDLKLIPSKTVRENVQFALEITDRAVDSLDDITEYLLDVVNLKERAHLFPNELSGGEKQRVAIARALANDPKLFIADEPTGNLDPDTAMEILEILETINSWGTTVLVITHDKGIVDRMQTRVLHMADGTIIADEKGGYFDSKDVQKGKKVEMSDKLKKDVNEREEDDNKMDDSIKRIGLKKSVLKKLEKNKVKDVEDLLDLTDKKLKELKFRKGEINHIHKVVENYFKEGSNEK